MKKTLLLLLFLPVCLYAETVYKSVDENGNVIFTDKPTEGAETIEVKEAQSVKLPDIPRFGRSSSSGKAESNEGDSYNNLAIISPKNDETIHNNEGNVTVSAMIEPGLKPNNKLVLYLDNKKVLSGTSNQFSLAYIDRGTHKLSVAVTSPEGKEIMRSDTVEFHLRRTSKLTDTSSDNGTPQNPPIPVAPGPPPRP